MFQSNEKLSVSTDQSQVELDRNIGNIHTYLTAVPQVRRTLLLVIFYGMSGGMFIVTGSGIPP